ncbi:MAG TPA: HAD family phosphatase [Planctomycetota bacterium]|nr:HAD family phosphatase [Planctomycetota bacterium]
MHVVFDLDGILVDSEPLWSEAIVETLALSGARYRPETEPLHRGMKMGELVPFLLREHACAAEPAVFAERLLATLLARFEDRLQPLPGAERALGLARAKGKIALASGSPLAVIRRVLERFGWRFDAVCSSDEVARGKPMPDVFLLAAERLGAAPGDCVAIEDSANGIAAAKAAGMRVIAVGDARGDPDVRIASLASLVL